MEPKVGDEVLLHRQFMTLKALQPLSALQSYKIDEWQVDSASKVPSMIKKILLLFFVFSPITAADNVSKLFGEGVFGTKWGQSLYDVKELFPNGEHTSFNGVSSYTIKDGRAVLGVERNKKLSIGFGFNIEEKLNSISIEYKTGDYGALVLKLNSIIGEGAPDYDLGVGNFEWQSNNEEINVRVLMSPVGLFKTAAFVVIKKDITLKESFSKEALGL
jgi:hypothetical protein